MANTNTPEYVKYSVYSKLDPSTNQFGIPSYEKDIKNIINNALKSALPKDTFFQVGEKELYKNGRARWDIYVHKDDESVVSESFSQIQEELTYKGSGNKRYIITNAKPVSDKQAKVLSEAESLNNLNNTVKESTKHTKGAVLKIIAIITTLADITRRILSHVIDFAVQSSKDMVTAHNLGMSYESVRSARITEKAHGLKEGTITEAVADIQNKFGNITSLDEKSLEALAVVMGGKIEEMATMGLGSSNPEAILGAILDDFNAKANAGYNSVGQYVGEQQARRELYSYLLKISPQIADIFATMQEEQHNINSLFRNQADTFEEWRNLVPTERGKHTKSDYNVVVTVGKEWELVKATLEAIKQDFETDFAPAVINLLRGIKNIRIGLSEGQNAELNKANREANEAEIKAVKKAINDYGNPSNKAESYYLMALNKYLDELEKANKGDIKGNIKNAVRTPEEIRVMANSLAGIEQGKPSISVPYTLDSITGTLDVSVDDILNVLSGYNKFDLDKEREKYNKELDKANKKISKANERIDNKVKGEYEASVKNLNDKKSKAELEKAKEYADNAVYKNKSSIYYVPEVGWNKETKSIDLTRLNTQIVGERKALASAEYIFGAFQGDTVKEKLEYALGKGYLRYTYNHGIRSQYPSINPEMLPDFVSEEEKTALQEEALLNNEKEQDLLKYDEEDFLMWLYANNARWFKEHLSKAELERVIEESKKGNKMASLFLLNKDEKEWIPKLPDVYEGMGELYGMNVQNEKGETVHKLILEIGVGDTKQQIEVGSFEGMESYEGYLGKLRFERTENGGVDYTVSVADSASEARYNQLKSEK